MLDPLDGSVYAAVHKQYHGSYKQLLEAFGYYDIFIVDAQSGNVVYSVFKEIDFATSLASGALRNSGLGEAYKAAMALPKAQTAFIDFAPYMPSYEAPAAFLATPIFENDNRIGVLIFQAPVDKINAIMNYDKLWQQRGLGQTGETYLVGEDKLMRSQSRLFVQNKEAFLALMRQQNVSDNVIAQIDAKNTTLGLAAINTEAVVRALQGDSGVIQAHNYFATPVISAYAPMDVFGLNWAIVSELSTAEGFSAKLKLLEAMTIAAVILSVIPKVSPKLVFIYQ
nr:cache domain-containing protein [Pseudoalteromonas sp. S16_S37]